MAKNKKITPAQAYLKKLLFAAPVMAAACLTLVFFGPFEILAFAGNAVRYDHRDIWLPLALVAFGVFVLTTTLLPLLKGKLFRYVITGFFALTLCGYVQTLVMNGSLGLLDGHAYTIAPISATFNTLAWLFLSVGCYVVLHLNRKWWRHLLRFGSLLIAVMQLAPIISIAFGGHNRTTALGHINLTQSGMYEYSENKNIYVFVLDRLDYEYIQSVAAKDPDFFAPLDGFTSYTNAISAYARTQPALNHLLTGCEEAFFCEKEEFYTDSWHEGDKQLLEDLDRLNFSTEIYANPAYLFGDGAYLLDHVDNAIPDAQVDMGAAIPRLLQLSALRWTPDLVKPLLYADTNAFNEGVMKASTDPIYETDDCYYADGFLHATAERSGNCFKFYHFLGSHAPYHMDANGNHSEEVTSAVDQTMGSFRNLYAAFDRMKELGIYQDATIIITGDHGNARWDSKPLQQQVTIGLFYKPSGSAGTPLVKSNAPVSTGNISATIMKQAGLANYSAYGQALDDIPEDADITRYYYKSVCEKETWHEIYLHVYAVKGDAKDFSNWEEIEIYTLSAENRFY